MRDRPSRDIAVWLLRVLWFVLPVTAGPTVADAAAELSDTGRIAVLAGAWIVWAVGLAAAAVLLPLSLTVIRVLAPKSITVTAWGLIAGDVSGLGIIGLVVAIAATAAAFSSLVGDRMVDGASYGDERRMLLRPPTSLLAGPIPLAWVLAAVGLGLGPAAFAWSGWILGAIATVAGLGLVYLAGRSLHQLSRRWIVFVPTGFVLHDLSALTEPVLFRRTAVERLGAAIDGTPARDLSLGAAGLVLECELTDAAPLGLRSNARTTGIAAELTDVRRFLFVPTRPGALLDEAESRRIAVD